MRSAYSLPKSDLLDNPQLQLIFDIDLCESERRDFRGATFHGLDITGASLGSIGKFEQCTFVQCMFHSVRFSWPSFDNVGFVNCTFYDCLTGGTANSTLWGRGCREFGCHLVANLIQETSRGQPDIDGHEKAELTHEILSLFWPTNKSQANLCLPLEALHQGRSPREAGNIDVVLQLLSKKGLLKMKNALVVLNENRIDEINALLRGPGRQ